MIGGFFWPRNGIGRGLAYLRHRVVRLPDTPHRIAAGLASGVAASLTPFIGLHFVLAALLASVTRGNVIASAIGTMVGNPWTFPVIWLVTYKLGLKALGMPAHPHPFADLTWTTVIEDPMRLFGPVLGPMMLGSVPLALLGWWLTYWPVRRLIGYYRARRAERLAAKQSAQGVKTA
ncbi:MAG: DUF2062 domain-containing protein [Alphaproteobacteria bacterium]|nr:MAG: DUF2062 domain-containing protein [Alphaproteobacteria bacterium]